MATSSSPWHNRIGVAGPIYRIVKLNADGTVNPTFAAGFGASDDVRSLVMDSNKVLVGGLFDIFNNQYHRYFLRLNSNGTIDSAFVSPSFVVDPNEYSTPRVNASAVQGDGKYLVAGEFSTVNNHAENYLVRLQTNGSVDTSFNASGFQIAGKGSYFFWSIKDLVLQNDKILIAGRFFPASSLTKNIPCCD